MNLKKEIYKTIIANCYTEEDKPEDSVIMGDDFDKLTNDLTELVKKMGYIPCCTVENEQLCDGLHSTDFMGKCFKCGEQVFVREDKKA